MCDELSGQLGQVLAIGLVLLQQQLSRESQDDTF
jgi:hypothetical protein